MERKIGTTELRQRLTDVLHSIREKRETYIIETFDRSQAALVNLEDYRLFRRFLEEREAFFDWLENTAARNEDRNQGLTDEQVLAIIDKARSDVDSRT